jgi:hypothetical protein
MKFHSLKLQLCILLIGFPILANSQQIQVSASKPDIDPVTTNLHKIIGHDKDNYFVLKFHNNQYYLEKLDKDLNFILTEPVILFNGLRVYDLETVVCFYGEIYVFVSKTRLNNITLYYQKIDKGNLKALTELIEITTIKNVKGNWADFHFALSREEKKLLVVCKMKLQFTKVQFNEYYVFGKNMSLIWTLKDSFKFTGHGPRDNKYIVDEVGNIAFLSLQYRQSILSLFQETKNSYSIYRYTNEGRAFKEFPVLLQNKYIRGIDIIGDDKGELICAGFYSEYLLSGIRGTFFFRIDSLNEKIYDQTHNDFESDLIERLEQSREPIINEKEVTDYVLTDLILRSNGMTTLIAEQFYDQLINTYNNLIVISYDPTGHVYWSRLVEKNQNFDVQTISDTGIDLSEYRQQVVETGKLDPGVITDCSYGLMASPYENGIIIFYNDNISNLDNPGSKSNYRNPRKSYLVAVKIDEYGRISKEAVVKWKKRGYFPQPMRYYDALNNCIVIPAFRYRKYIYYKINASF